MRFNNWLAYISTLYPKMMDLSLARISDLAQRLGLTRLNAQVITVAGTNGKGSTVALIEALLLASGARTAVYTSPHLFHFSERLRYQGQAVPESDFIQAFEHINLARGKQALTYFEFITLSALWQIKQYAVDYAILEIGLGGRLDAVNSTEPDLAVLTSIDLDHCDRLGNTREAIALEKFAVARPLKPLILGDRKPPPILLEQAKHLPCLLWQKGRDFDYRDHPETETWSFTGPYAQIDRLPKPKLALENAANALMVCQILGSRSRTQISHAAMVQGLKQAYLPGRCEWLSLSLEDNTVLVIRDVAHNPAGTAFLAQHLREKGLKPGACTAVFGMLNTKDILNAIHPIRLFVRHWFFSPLQTPASASLSNLEQALEQAGVAEKDRTACRTVSEAYQKALEARKPDKHKGDERLQQHIVLVFGSFHTVSEAFPNEAKA